MEFLSLKRLSGGGLGEGASSLGTLEDMLKRTPIRLSSWGPLSSRGEPGIRRRAHIPETFKDE
jgi:hypothetical protein